MSRIRAFKHNSGNSEEMSRLVAALEDFFSPIAGSRIIDGVLLKNVELITGQINQIEHKLQRAPIGWTVVRLRQNAVVWDSQDTNTFKSRTLALNSSANATVDLWVF